MAVWDFFSDELEPPGPGPWMWNDTSMLGIDIEVDGGAADDRLPFGLRIARPARATLLIADYTSSIFGAYSEAGLILHAVAGFKPVLFWAWMIVDHDGALVFGRDTLGVPKKLGRVDVSSSGDRIDVVVERRGTTLIDLQADIGAPAPDAPPLMGRWSVNVRGAVGVAIPWLIAFRSAEEVIEARHADVSIRALAGSTADPIDSLGFGDVVGAHWYRTNFGGLEKLPALPILPVDPGFMIRNWDLRFR